MGKTLYIDCFSGVAGDMFLGACLDLGLPLDALRDALGSLAIDHGTIRSERVLRAGVSATKFTLVERALAEQQPASIQAAADHARATGRQHHTHSHEHPHDHHTHDSGAGTGKMPWAQRTVPLPTLTGDATT